MSMEQGFDTEAFPVFQVNAPQVAAAFPVFQLNAPPAESAFPVFQFAGPQATADDDDEEAELQRAIALSNDLQG